MVSRAARTNASRVAALSIGLLLSASAAAAGPGGWDHLGTGATPSLSALNDKVDSLLNVSSTALYAGGAFTGAGGDPAARMIARWDGAGWHPIGPTAISTASGASVDAIAYDGVTGRIFVGGNFIDAGGTAAADFVAYWNGFSWQSPCNFSPEGQRHLAADHRPHALRRRGLPAPAGLPDGQSLLACDIDSGTTTATVTAPIKMNGSIYALTADSAGNLYAAGTFINMDGTLNSNYVARYDGAAWHAMVPGAVTAVTRSIASDGTNVYIGSDGLDIGSIPNADHVARWNGSAWSAVGANSTNTDGWLPATASINSISASASGIFVAGSFQNADGQSTADEVAQFRRPTGRRSAPTARATARSWAARPTRSPCSAAASSRAATSRPPAATETRATSRAIPDSVLRRPRRRRSASWSRPPRRCSPPLRRRRCRP